MNGSIAELLSRGFSSLIGAQFKKIYKLSGQSFPLDCLKNDSMIE